MYRSSYFLAKEAIMLTLRAVFPDDWEFPIVRTFASSVYEKRLDVVNPANPDAYAVLFDGDSPIACAGIFHAITHRPLFFERFFDKEILKEICPQSSRKAIAELGALAVDAPPSLEKQVQQLAAVILIAATLIANSANIDHLVFIGDRLLPRFSRLFGVPFHNYGRVEPDNIEPEFRAKLTRYFKVGRNAYSVPTAPASHVANEFLFVLAESLHIDVSSLLLACDELIPSCA